MDTAPTIAFLAVVGGRFVLPLFILRWPLPAILACLVLDGYDQTIFQAFGYDPPGYQSYDKAMDVFYLAVAYMSTLRNWTNGSAYGVGRGLYFYRLVGVVAFELSQWRALLLVFANTFEYFFIASEALRLRWNPLRWALRWWTGVAAFIWVVVKLPQEWWIHVAKRDMSDTLAANPWLWTVIVAVVVAALVAFQRVLKPQLGPVSWPWRVRADPFPVEVDEARQRAAWTAEHGRVLSRVTVEKVVLIGLLCVIFGELLPGTDASRLELFLGIGVLVVANAAFALWAARRSRTVETLAAAFFVRVAFNIAIVLVEDWLLGAGPDLNRSAALFFIVMLSLLVTMHDRYWPVHQVRLSQQQGPVGQRHPRRSGGAPGRAAGTAPGTAP